MQIEHNHPGIVRSWLVEGQLDEAVHIGDNCLLMDVLGSIDDDDGAS